VFQKYNSKGELKTTLNKYKEVAENYNLIAVDITCALPLDFT
jgi:hypothetical protein